MQYVSVSSGHFVYKTYNSQIYFYIFPSCISMHDEAPFYFEIIEYVPMCCYNLARLRDIFLINISLIIYIR
ncbi:hypothetical protein SBF1_3410008 [Candidatus Desulfosporosinus infrequens]|uniref:Uncharacterized protein n=1 Tax=Candidatus Desulfosporosinus infrequens TaxID=2043169 RepID=A0A2U3L1Z0_9FIRM|nr:hypothetical protein SBF1_3410008 [Candidatus Desulfosporosinus infrequens]